MKKMLLITASVALMGVVSTANAEGAGEKTYKMACFACHGTGAAGSPKMGDKAAWTSRIAQGNAKLHEHAIKGYKINLKFNKCLTWPTIPSSHRLVGEILRARAGSPSWRRAWGCWPSTSF